MPTTILDPLIDFYKGHIGDFVYYIRNNRQFKRRYVIPRNTYTAARRKTRNTFSAAVREWQRLTDNEKHEYNNMAKNLNMSGYNLFISEYMNANFEINEDKSSEIIHKITLPASKPLLFRQTEHKSYLRTQNFSLTAATLTAKSFEYNSIHTVSPSLQHRFCFVPASLQLHSETRTGST